MNEDTRKRLSKIIRIDERAAGLTWMRSARGTVEKTLNALPDAEADEMCNAQRYEHSPDRVEPLTGPHCAPLHIDADSSVELAHVRIYVAGVSVR